MEQERKDADPRENDRAETAEPIQDATSTPASPLSEPHRKHGDQLDPYIPREGGEKPRD